MGEEIKPLEKEPVLSFDQFSYRPPGWETDTLPRYNNFYVYFGGGGGEYRYRQKPHYLKFVKENPNMAVELCNKIHHRNRSGLLSQSLKPLDRELYEAYKIMRSYGVSDKDLFE